MSTPCYIDCSPGKLESTKYIMRDWSAIHADKHSRIDYLGLDTSHALSHISSDHHLGKLRRACLRCTVGRYLDPGMLSMVLYKVHKPQSH